MRSFFSSKASKESAKTLEQSPKMPINRALSVVSEGTGLPYPTSIPISSTSPATALLQSGLSIGACSRVGYSGGPKVNQDAHWELPVWMNDPDQHFFGVADGHGVNGHHVSDLIRRRLGTILGKEPTLRSNTSVAFEAAYSKANSEITSSAFDVAFSGSTCVSVLLQEKKILCANVGDSRAILGKESGGIWEGIPLSRDHKPDLPMEQARIVSKKGRVEPYKLPSGESIGPHRVWVKSQEFPGLGMSRAMGDSVAATVGVIAEPEVQSHDLLPDHKFLVIASDGVWEFMSNDEVSKLVGSFASSRDAVKAATALVSEAQDRWRANEDIIDDTTAVVVFLPKI